MVNTTTQDDQLIPTIADLATGGFAVTWADSSATLGDSSGTSIKAQIFKVINVGTSGDDWLDGRGGADTLQGRAGNDRYHVDNVDDQVIEVADAGIDRATASVSYVLAVNVENLKLSGPAAIDGTGNADRNIMAGNAADNILKGLDGNDRLLGGAGADQFVFDTAPHRFSNLDRVTDFVSGTDSLVLDKSVFTAFSAVGAVSAEAFRSGAGANAAQDADDRLIYNTSNGVLLYDADGSGAGQSVRIAVLGGSQIWSLRIS